MDTLICAECGEETATNLGRPHSAWGVPIGQADNTFVFQLDFAGKGGRPVLCKECVRKVVDRGIAACGL